MANVTVSFTFDDKEDHQLRRWLDSLPKGHKSESIRAVLRSHLGLGTVTLGDVYQAVKEVDRKLQNGVVMAQFGEPADTDDAPGVCQEALDNLAKLGR